MSDPERSAEAVARLDAITRRLRLECPWDREQDERSIVPHTVEEAYELADAVEAGDDAKSLDELGDVLFQVHFLSLLLEERGAGDMAAVADHCREKLIRRHPHVFPPGEQGSDAPAAGPVAEEDSSSSQAAGEEPTSTPPTEGASRSSPLDADAVLGQWDRIKREVEGQGGDGDPFADVPENLPALLHARKLQRRAANRAGGAGLSASPLDAAGRARRALAELEAITAEGADAGPATDPETREAIETALGDALFAAVDAARQLRCDPELALRAASARYRREHSEAN